MTLNRVLVVILRYLIEFDSLGANYIKVRPILSATKCGPKKLIFGNIIIICDKKWRVWIFILRVVWTSYLTSCSRDNRLSLVLRQRQQRFKYDVHTTRKISLAVGWNYHCQIWQLTGVIMGPSLYVKHLNYLIALCTGTKLKKSTSNTRKHGPKH